MVGQTTSVYDVALGFALVDKFQADRIPAFDVHHSFTLVAGMLLQHLPAYSPAVGWSFVGDARPNSAPIVVNGRVYIGSKSGQLYALDEQSGDLVWSSDVGAPIGDGQEFTTNVDGMPDGLAVGGGALIVPAFHRLVAYW